MAKKTKTILEVRRAQRIDWERGGNHEWGAEPHKKYYAPKIQEGD